MERIIDADIRTLTASVETHEAQLRRAHRRDEPAARAVLTAARVALSAMLAYRIALDSNPLPPLER